MAIRHPASAVPSAWWKRSLFIVAVLLVLGGLLVLLPPVHGQTAPPLSTRLSCGNGVLDPGENCENCEVDAGVCAPFSILCGSGNVCRTPVAPCPAIKPCQPVPPGVLADAKLVYDSLRPGLVRQAARRVLAALRAMDAYCPETPSTGQMTLVLSTDPARR